MSMSSESDLVEAELVEAALAGEKWPSCVFCGQAIVRFSGLGPHSDDMQHEVFVSRPGLGVPIVYVSRCNVKKISRYHA